MMHRTAIYQATFTLPGHFRNARAWITDIDSIATVIGRIATVIGRPPTMITVKEVDVVSVPPAVRVRLGPELVIERTNMACYLRGGVPVAITEGVGGNQIDLPALARITPTVHTDGRTEGVWDEEISI